MKRFITFILLLSCFLSVFAEKGKTKEKKEKPSSRYITLDAGFNVYKSRDQFHSPLLFTGGGIALRASIEKNYAKRITFGIHNVDVAVLDGRGSDNLVFNYNYQTGYLFQFKTYKGGVIYLGHMTQFLFNNRVQNSYVNNGYTYEWGLNIAFSARYKNSFDLWKRNFTWSYQPNLPVINYIYRPSFASSYINAIEEQEDPSIRDIIKSGEWLTANRRTAFSNTTSLQLNLKTGNAIRLGYDWGLYSYRGTRNSFLAYHRLLFTLMMEI